MAPRYLFRVYSAESNGTNTHSHFEPASFRTSLGSVESSETQQTACIPIGEKLKIALLGQQSPSNPFVFFTSSLLFALQIAAYKRSKGETDIYITCIDTTTATGSDGSTVDFKTAGNLMKAHGVELRNRSEGSLRGYDHELVVTETSVRLGEGSSYLVFQDLINKGLYRLYPELEEVNQRRNVRLHLAVTDLRRY